MTATVAFVLFIVAISLPARANSKCGTGNAPSYDDVNAVMFTQNGCKNTIQDADVAALKGPQFPHGWFAPSYDCSTFWVLFWNDGRENVPTTYSQYNLRGAVGTFTLSATLNDATALLRRDHFYALNPGSNMVTDTARAVITVKRCAVITRISAYNMQGSSVGQDAATLKLFDDFRVLVREAAKKQLSSFPKNFELTKLFDP